MFKRFKENQFLFVELIKRDFKKKYKRTFLGMLWSVLSPLLTLLIMRLVFTEFFGNQISHYTTYLFCGTVVWSFFSDATNGGMSALMSNANIFSKINVPKYLFLFSKIVSSLINFGLTFLVFLLFCGIDKVPLTPYFLTLPIPIFFLIVFNIGVGLILSALYVFFRDIQYLWGVFLTLLNYLSAIFYDVARFPEWVQKLFYLNPVYAYIKYFRVAVIDGQMPSLLIHGLVALYALLALGIGALIYKRCNHKFLYYI